MTIDKIVQADKNEIFDGRHIWLFVNEQVDWVKKGCGFIFRNFNGAFKTKKEALNDAYHKMSFLGGNWKLEANEKNYVSYVRDNGRIYVMRYDLEGPSIFDMNH